MICSPILFSSLLPLQVDSHAADVAVVAAPPTDAAAAPTAAAPTMMIAPDHPMGIAVPIAAAAEVKSQEAPRENTMTSKQRE